ncbi:MAG: MmcQ/YjbR family DNA-binding protein [Clostridia bacterium]
MTRQELIDYCLTFPGIIETYPFEDKNSTIMRHITNKKWFALIFEMDDNLLINLKCDPFKSDFLRQTFNGVTAAWHMNKVHWNTISVNSDVPINDLYDLINDSFSLTSGKFKK